MVISRDKKVTTGDFNMLNLNYLDWYALKYFDGQTVSPKANKIEGNVYSDSMYAPAGAFTWTGMIKSYNQAAINGFMVLGGQMICTAPLRQGKLTGVTGV
jgi:hypothetical protein